MLERLPRFALAFQRPGLCRQLLQHLGMDQSMAPRAGERPRLKLARAAFAGSQRWQDYVRHNISSGV